MWEAFNQPGAHNKAEDRIAQKFERFVVQRIRALTFVRKGAMSQGSVQQPPLLERIANAFLKLFQRLAPLDRGLISRSSRHRQIHQHLQRTSLEPALYLTADTREKNNKPVPPQIV